MTVDCTDNTDRSDNMKAAILNGYDKKGCDLVIKDFPIPDVSEDI